MLNKYGFEREYYFNDRMAKDWNLILTDIAIIVVLILWAIYAHCHDKLSSKRINIDQLGILKPELSIYNMSLYS